MFRSSDSIVMLCMHDISPRFVVLVDHLSPLPIALPFKEFAKNPNTALVVTKRGGHFGFIEGVFPVGATWMDRALQQSLTALKSLQGHK